MSASGDFKVTHISEARVRTVQTVRGAAGPWQAIEWVEQQRGLGWRCGAIRQAPVPAPAPAPVTAEQKGGAS